MNKFDNDKKERENNSELTWKIPTTELHISNKLVELSKFSRCISFRVYQLLIRRNREEYHIYDHTKVPNLSNTKKFNITSDFWELSLDDGFLERLTHYIRNESKILESDLANWWIFDCTSFVEYVKWIETDEEKFDLWGYKMKELDVQELNWWEIVILWNKINFENFTILGVLYLWLHLKFKFIPEHTMIYIWNWLYMSKAGNKYWLIVWTLGELQKLYHSNNAFILEKKD